MTIASTAETAAGTPLGTPFTSSFTTLREITTRLTSNAALAGGLRRTAAGTVFDHGLCGVGDDASQGTYRCLLSFELEGIDLTAASIESATLTFDQAPGFAADTDGFALLGEAELQDVTYSARDAAAFGDTGTVIESYTERSRGRSVDVTRHVVADFDAARSQTQFRFQFQTEVANNGDNDLHEVDEAELTVTYLLP